MVLGTNRGEARRIAALPVDSEWIVTTTPRSTFSGLGFLPWVPERGAVARAWYQNCVPASLLASLVYKPHSIRGHPRPILASIGSFRRAGTVVVLLASAVLLRAQTDTGTIRGHVYDQTRESAR